MAEKRPHSRSLLEVLEERLKISEEESKREAFLRFVRGLEEPDPLKILLRRREV